MLTIAVTALLTIAAPGKVAPDEPANAAGYIKRDGLEAGVRNFASDKLQHRRYFEGGSADACTKPILTEPGYEGIPVTDCTYVDSGLQGWVRLASVPADLMSDWILNAAKLCKKPNACAAKLADDLWESNNYSFPIAGIIVERGNSVGGGSGGATNLMFIHGVTVERPAILPEHAVLDIELQKRCALALLAYSNGVVPAPVSGDPNNSCAKIAVVRQVSRPAAVRQDIYISYGDPKLTKEQRASASGPTCPAESRKLNWLAISRSGFIEGWKSRHHPLIDTAARAIDAGMDGLGWIDCAKQ
ncbi:hypothetical protein OF829_11805 [Sphingomonas sp. LB-2]|uniref:hypothetical protein n=1 Tax=Sphingomonas caeni TaxID=2984949 RepID=UPI002230CFA1|nr:hypothetical protein [Sphingomonas caeni]MCW3847926.1 hypothetical protein [Sphingomonas caeni]